MNLPQNIEVTAKKKKQIKVSRLKHTIKKLQQHMEIWIYQSEEEGVDVSKQTKAAYDEDTTEYGGQNEEGNRRCN